MNIKDLIVEDSPSDDEEDTSPILVSEFPPPPYYYTLASSLIPPEIPTQSLVQVAKQVQKTIASLGSNKTVKDADKSSFPSSVDARTTPTVDETMMDIHTVPAVFGEIVEDPLLMHVEDLCEDPTIVRDEILRLRSQVLHGFVQLLQQLVNDPLNHLQYREEMSKQILNMLLETNKLREHQARELLIGRLEAQLSAKIQAIQELRENINQGRNVLEEMKRLL